MFDILDQGTKVAPSVACKELGSLRDAGMVSTYTYLRFGGRNGVHLHIFDILGPEWGPFTHISILGPGMVSIYTYFNFGRCPLIDSVNRIQ